MGKYWRQIKSVGGHGSTVAVIVHRRRRFYLKWWDPGTRSYKRQKAEINEREAAIKEAEQLSASLLAGMRADEAGLLTLAALFDLYQAKKSKHKKGAQPLEDARRMELWEAFLSPQRDVTRIALTDLDDFVRERAAGTIKALPRWIPELNAFRTRDFSRKVSNATIGADIVFLESTLNWATRYRQENGTRLLLENPILGYQRPRERNPRRVVASYDRFLAVRKQADLIDGQKRFGAFMDLVESLGWRVTALCQLRADDIDRKKTKQTPWGQIRKRGDVDKEGVEMWVPLASEARRAIDRIPVVGGFLFPQPRNPAKPWNRHHAKNLLERAEAAAGLQPLRGADFHAYRRKWATERKALPIQDVAHAGGWRDFRTLERAYQQVDPQTLLAVVTEKKKLREAK